jgi:hypothetical protein
MENGSTREALNMCQVGRHMPTHPLHIFLWALAKHSELLPFGFLPLCRESSNVNLGKIAIFCCLNCISECVNGFNLLKNHKALQLYKLSHSNLQIQPFFTEICRSNHSLPDFRQNQKNQKELPYFFYVTLFLCKKFALLGQ